MRYNPVARAGGENPFFLDSQTPTVPFREYAYGELRYRMLTHANPDEAARLLVLAQEAVAQRWKTYAEMATRGG